MIKNIRHAAIVVSDLKKCQEFYESFFGFSLVKEDIETGPFIESVVGLSNVKLHWVKLRTPNGIIIELLQYLSPASPPKPNKQQSNQLGHSHLAFTVENIDQFIIEFKKRNGVVVNMPMINPENTAKVCYVYDTEENILEIVEEV